MTDSLSMAIHAFASRVLMSISVVKTLLLKKVNLLTSFKDLPLYVEVSPLWLKHLNTQRYSYSGFLVGSTNENSIKLLKKIFYMES